MAQTHEGWETIFGKLAIVERVNADGFFDISADQIKEIANKEPRLMAKIDFREHLPPIMKKEGMAIFAIANGKYRIGRFDPFIKIGANPNVTPVTISFPNDFITLNPKNLTQESAVLDAALLTGMLDTVFGEKVALTVRGRSRSPNFSFSFGGVSFPISGVQIEVDGGYEGPTSVNLVEAKIGSPNNLNVRQLIYPQLAWESNLGMRKVVKTYVCFYQEPIVRFIPIVYDNGECRADSEHESAFILEPEAKLDLLTIKANPNAPTPLLGVPFPQADRFDTVLAMFSIVVREEEIHKDLLLQDFDIDPRQIDYYTNAMRWIGLVHIEHGVVRLTPEGRKVSALTHAEKLKYLAEVIFREPIYNYVLQNRTSEVPATLFNRWNINSDSTRNRRIQTVQAWIKYFEEITQAVG